MKIFVTGGNGFLGSRLVTELRAQGHTVIAPTSRECDLRSGLALNHFSAQKFDQIYHLAAWTQAGDFCLKHPGEQWIVNQQINTSLLDWWAKYQTQAKLISIGTSCSYPVGRPLSEENYLQGEPITDLYTYGMTKRMLLIGQKALAQQFGLQFATFIPSTLYGPGYHTDGRQMHFIFDLIRKFLDGRDRGEEITLWGNGHQRRELVHVDDFIRSMLDAVPLVSNSWVNLGAGADHSIREFANLLCELTGVDQKKIRYDENRYVGAQSKRLEIARIQSLLGERYSLRDLKTGLQETIRWFEAAFGNNHGRS